MLALTEMLRRKVQFSLVTAVVVLIAYLVLMVTGLGLGLQEKAGTALLNLDGEYLAYADRANLSVIRSRLTEAQVADVTAAPGVEAATPLGYVAAVVEYGDDKTGTAALIGVDPGSFAEPTTIDGDQLSGIDEVLIDRSWASLGGTEVGDTIALPVGFDTREFTVVGIVDQGSFFFQPAIYLDRTAWQEVAYQGAAEQTPAASIVGTDQHIDARETEFLP